MNTLLRHLKNYKQWALIHLLVVLTLWGALWLISARIPFYQQTLNRFDQIKDYQLEIDSTLKSMDSLKTISEYQQKLLVENQYHFDLKKEDILSWLRNDLLQKKLFLVAFNTDPVENNQEVLKGLKRHRGVLEVKGDFAQFIQWTHQLDQDRVPFFVHSFQASVKNAKQAKQSQWQNKVLVEWYAK